MIAKLPPGKYWLAASYLDISAAGHCFHVSPRPGVRAGRVMKYEWGEFPQVVRRAAGSIHDVRPGTGGNPVWNLVHPVMIPIARASVRLQGVHSNEVRDASSDERGEFAFEGVPGGTWVLRVEGGSAGPYEATSVVLDVRERASRSRLLLRRSDVQAGSCGNLLDVSSE